MDLSPILNVAYLRNLDEGDVENLGSRENRDDSNTRRIFPMGDGFPFSNILLEF